MNAERRNAFILGPTCPGPVGKSPKTATAELCYQPNFQGPKPVESILWTGNRRDDTLSQSLHSAAGHVSRRGMPAAKRRSMRPNTFLAGVAITSGAGVCAAGVVYRSQPGFDTVQQRALVLGSFYLLIFGIICPLALLVVKRLRRPRPLPIPRRSPSRRSPSPQPPPSPAPNAASIRNLQWKPASAVAREVDGAVRHVA
jgi:hypothetical protein